MKKLVIFAGTTEGRRLSEILADAGIAHTVCVATEYGEIVMREQTESTKAMQGQPGSPLVNSSLRQNGSGADGRSFCMTKAMRL